MSMPSIPCQGSGCRARFACPAQALAGKYIVVKGLRAQYSMGLVYLQYTYYVVLFITMHLVSSLMSLPCLPVRGSQGPLPRGPSALQTVQFDGQRFVHELNDQYPELDRPGILTGRLPVSIELMEPDQDSWA